AGHAVAHGGWAEALIGRDDDVRHVGLVVPRPHAGPSPGESQRALTGARSHGSAAYLPVPPPPFRHGRPTLRGVRLSADGRTFACRGPGPDQPERIARLEAVAAGTAASDVLDALVPLPGREATREELRRVHDATVLDAVAASSAARGALD